MFNFNQQSGNRFERWSSNFPFVKNKMIGGLNIESGSIILKRNNLKYDKLSY